MAVRSYDDHGSVVTGSQKKWTTVNWTQDDTNLSYQQNPRVTETMQNDPVNFVDPSGLLPSDGQCQGAECPWGGGGGGFWGGGFDMNNRQSLINPSGRDTITEAEYDHDYRYSLETIPIQLGVSMDDLVWLASAREANIRA